MTLVRHIDAGQPRPVFVVGAALRHCKRGSRFLGAIDRRPAYALCLAVRRLLTRTLNRRYIQMYLLVFRWATLDDV